MGALRLTLAEEELMIIFWEMDRPLTSVEILQEANDKTWTGNYLHKMLRKLEKEQFLKVCGMVQYGKQYARQFAPIVSQADYTASVLKRQKLTVKSFAKVALAFTKDESDTESDQTNQRLIEDLENMIEELRTEEKD